MANNSNEVVDYDHLRRVFRSISETLENRN